MSFCHYCHAAPTIRASHVVPRFMGEYIKKNSPFGHMLNTWQSRPVYDLHKGPYLCAQCDNELFSSWEGFFASSIFRDPLALSSNWSDERSIKFALSLAFRYAVHFIETSPILVNRPYSEFLRGLTHSALMDSTLVGRSIFIYPYVHRAISSGCELIPGINHLLSLTVHGESLPQEGDLPNAMMVVVPKITFLFCDRDLSDCSGNEVSNPVPLLVGVPFDPLSSNIDLPLFIGTVLNRLIGHGQGHQKQIGRWKKLAYGADKLLHPEKACYVAQGQDQELLNWQRAKCR